MCDDVLSRVLDSTDATVGGGSASALAGAMGAGLVGMVARLSMQRGLGLTDAEYAERADDADGLCRSLYAGAGDDADAYAGVKAAYGLARGDRAAIAAREAAIHEALIRAATVPLDNARRALRVRELCDELAQCSNPSAASDLAAAVLLADAAVAGCLLNVDVNTALLPASPAAERLKNEATSVRVSHREAAAPVREGA